MTHHLCILLLLFGCGPSVDLGEPLPDDAGPVSDGSVTNPPGDGGPVSFTGTPLLSTELPLGALSTVALRGCCRSVAVAAGDAMYVIVWPTVASPLGGQLRAARVTRDGEILDPGGVFVTELASEVTPHVAWTGSSFLVTSPDVSGTLETWTIDPGSGAIAPTSLGGRVGRAPRLALDIATSSRGIMVYVSDATGRPTAEANVLHGGPRGLDVPLGPVEGRVSAAVATSHFVAVLATPDGALSARRIESDAPHTAEPFDVAAASGSFVRSPVVARSGDVLFVAWYDTGTGDVLGARMHASDFTAVDIAPIVLTSLPMGTDPVVLDIASQGELVIVSASEPSSLADGAFLGRVIAVDVSDGSVVDESFFGGRSAAVGCGASGCALAEVGLEQESARLSVYDPSVSATDALASFGRPSAGGAPRVAFQVERYLAVWNAPEFHVLQGARVRAADGAREDPSVEEDLDIGGSGHPNLTVAGAGGDFLAVWIENSLRLPDGSPRPGHRAVRAARIRGSDGEVSAPVELSSAAIESMGLASADGRYLVTFSRVDELVTMLLDSEGRRLAESVGPVPEERGLEMPSASVGGEFLVGVGCTLLSVDSETAAQTIVDDCSDERGIISISGANDRYLVLGYDVSEGAYDADLRDLRGDVIGDVDLPPGLTGGLVAVATASDGYTFVVLWSAGATTVHSARYALDGTPLSTLDTPVPVAHEALSLRVASAGVSNFFLTYHGFDRHAQLYRPMGRFLVYDRPLP